MQAPKQVKPLLINQLSTPDTCFFCGEKVYVVERHTAEGIFFHRGCFRCHYCSGALRLGAYTFQQGGDGERELDIRP